MVKAFPLNQQEYSYNAQDVSYYYAGRHSGVFALDTNCQVSIVSNMTIKVAKGKGWLAHGVDYGVVFWMEEDVELTVPVGDVASPRWDYVVVGWETTEVKQNPTIYIKSGSPAVTPAEPTLENSANKIEICLAKIYIPSGTTNLMATGVTLTDTRADKNYCGLVGDDLRITKLEERATALENKASNIESGVIVVGEAQKAKRLSNTRSINGANFDGSSNITTPQWGLGRNITIDGVKNLINGSSDINFNTIGFYRVSLIKGQVSTHYGCTKVGEKQLIKLTINNQGNAGEVAKITIKGQGVKQFVMFFQNLEVTYVLDNGFPSYGEEIDANGSITRDYRYPGFVFIIGVPN